MRRWGWRRYIILFGASLFGASLFGASTALASTSAISPGCGQPTGQALGGSPPPSASRQGATAKAVILTPANDNSKLINRNFGHDRGVYRRSLAFIASRALTIDPRNISVSVAGGLIDPTTTDVFPTDSGQLAFGAAIDPNTPTTLTINICIDPSHPDSVATGQYLGTLLITGPHIAPAQIPITLILKSPKLWLVWFAAVLGLVLGIGVKLLADRVKPPANPSANPAIRVMSMLVVGAILTVGVVLKLYYDPPTFGDSFANYWPIIIGAATATAGGTTLVDLFKGT
jgi:hypothetical protein